MKGIVYYNNKGKILNIVWGDDVVGEDEGIPFLEIDVPAGAVIDEVDLSSIPPKIVFTKYPESDYDKLNTKVTNISDNVTTITNDVATHAQQISDSEESITNLELAVASLYEGSI